MLRHSIVHRYTGHILPSPHILIHIFSQVQRYTGHILLPPHITTYFSTGTQVTYFSHHILLHIFLALVHRYTGHILLSPHITTYFFTGTQVHRPHTSLTTYYYIFFLALVQRYTGHILLSPHITAYYFLLKYTSTQVYRSITSHITLL